MEQAGIEIAHVGADHMGQGRGRQHDRRDQGDQERRKETVGQGYTPRRTAVLAMVK